jgi:lipopolysaccharide export system permease protein
MRAPRTLASYVGREILGYTGLGFVAILSLLVSQNMLRRLEDQLEVGFTATDLVSVFACVVPILAAYAVPIAFLFGALLAVGRLATDGEILALRVCGLGLRAVLLPALVLGALASALTAYLMLDMEHAAHRHLSSLFKEVAARGGALEPGRFRTMGDRIIFVRERDREGHLEGIMISDRSDPERAFEVFAERGRFVFDEEKEEVHIRLFNGDLHVDGGDADPGHYRRLAFARFDYAFDVSDMLRRAASLIPPRQMSNAELRAVLARAARGDPLDDMRERNPVAYALEIHRRLALPFAPLVFAPLAVALGMRPARHERWWGALVCLCVSFAYYAALAVAQMLARDGWVGAAAALWTPNALFGAGAALLLFRAERRGAG